MTLEYMEKNDYSWQEVRPWTFKGSVYSAVVDQLGNIVSIGIVSLPYCVYQIGIVPAFFYFIFGIVVTTWSSDLLFQDCFLIKSVYSYSKTYKLTRNLSMLKFDYVLIFILCGGYQVSYNIYTANQVQFLFGYTWLKGTILTSSNSFRITTFVIQFFLCFPITLFRRIKDFQAITMTYMSIMFFIMGVVIWKYYHEQGRRQVGQIKWYSTNALDYLSAFPFVIFNYGAQPWIQLICEGIDDKSRYRFVFMQVANWICCVLYLTIAIFGYLVYLEATPASLFTSVDNTSAIELVCIIGLVAANIMNMSYNLFPMRNVLILMLYGHDNEAIDSVSMWEVGGCSVAINVMCYLCSIITDDITTIMNVFSNTVVVYMCFMVPTLLYVHQMRYVYGTHIWDCNAYHIGAWLIFFISGFFGVVSFVMSFT